jgi:hypothetical protein
MRIGVMQWRIQSKISYLKVVTGDSPDRVIPGPSVDGNASGNGHSGQKAANPRKKKSLYRSSRNLYIEREGAWYPPAAWAGIGGCF